MFVLRRFAIGCNVLKSSQEKSKTMVRPFFGGGGGRGANKVPHTLRKNDE